MHIIIRKDAEANSGKKKFKFYTSTVKMSGVQKTLKKDTSNFLKLE